MSKKIIFFLLLILVLINLVISYKNISPTIEPKPVVAQELVPTEDQVVTIEAKQLDNRAAILKDYLALKNSPLQYHSQDLIDAADQYQLDWRLVTAIAGVESNFGRITPGGFNGWGWGVYGNQAIRFGTWRDGIFTVTKGLKENYVNRGLVTPAQMNRVYASSPTWGSKVSFFLYDIESYAKQHEQAEGPKANLPTISEAGNSAQLVASK